VRYRYISLFVTCILLFCLSGCGGITLPGFIKEELTFDDRCKDTPYTETSMNSDMVTDADGEISSDYLKALLNGESKIDYLLNCALAEAPDNEARLYRAHVLLSLLASYGAYNLSVGQYEESIGDAITLLSHIKQAETSLRKASSVVEPTAAIFKFQDNRYRIERISKLLEVALYAERPTLRRAKRSVRSLIGAIAADAPPSVVKSGIEGAMTGIRKSIHLRLYGKAYLDDAREDLERFADGSITPSIEDWQRRDILIQEACDKISLIAKLERYSCLTPEDAEI
jgi:hypothetical protein